jgi:hypothetical protein
LVYVRKTPTEKAEIFARREVQVLGRKQNRWVLATNQDLGAGEEVVSRNAQMLLSEEFRMDVDND